MSRLPSDSGQLVGQQVGDFFVQRLLGVGGMGEVYLAEQLSLHRPVALKVLRSDLARDDQYLRRFEAEARAIAPIHHPNIVSVHAIGENDGVHFIAFEYVRGVTLRHYIDRQGPLDESTCLRIASRVTAALVRAGEAGIIHRDIKPENVLITKRGEVKVADFGLARQSGDEDVRLTQTGVTMGTPLYMSPEQIQGHSLDVRSDIYSLGVMCYHMLTGEPPYRGETAMAVAIQHVHGKPDSLSELRPDVRPELIRVIARMMSKRPEDRYASAADLYRDLERMRAGEGHLIELMPGIEFERIDRRSLWQRWRDRAASVALASSRPPYRIWTAIATVLFAFVVGAACVVGVQSWMNRPLRVDKLELPDVSSIETRNTGFMQLQYALNVLEDRQREIGLWAVLIHFPGDEENTVRAAQELASILLPDRRYSELEQVSDYMTSREDPDQQVFGYLLRGICMSRMGHVKESTKSFDTMLRLAAEATFEPEQLDWLARQYFLTLKSNSEVLERKPEDVREMRNRFWQTFRVSNGER